MKKFLSVFMVSAIAICVGTSAMAVKVDTGGNSEEVKNTAKQKAGGDVYAQTIEKLKHLDSLKDDNAGEEVNNLITALSEEELQRRKSDAEDQILQYKDDREREAEQNKERLQKEKEDRKKQRDQEKQKKIDDAYEQCMAKAKDNQRSQTACDVQKKEAMQKAGLSDVGPTPEEKRIAAEEKASKEYEECISKGASQKRCQAKLDKAYEEAKKEQWAADPDQARKEMSDEYEKCVNQTASSGSSSYCKQKYKESLREAGLEQDADAVEMTARENFEAKAVEAEKEYNECVKTKSASKCAKDLNEAYDKAQTEYYRENPEQAREDTYAEFDKCTAQNAGARGEAYCRSKAKETLDKAGLTDDIKMDPADTKVAKEVQAEKDYDACISGGKKSASSCQREYDKATDAAKIEYYRTEPEKALQEIDAEYQKCKTNASPQQMQRCNQTRENTLKRAGLSTDIGNSNYMSTDK